MTETNSTKTPWYILPTIVISLFMGTSLWFATNVIVKDLGTIYSLPEDASSNITSAVQFGFMAGTLLFAFLNISDRMAPRLLFLLSSLLGGFLNLLILWWADSFIELILLRFLTGVALAGIYPVAIKTAATWFPKSILGKAIGFTVGALALGTALPHLIAVLGADLQVSQVIYLVSGLAILGGLLMYILVPNGPYLKPAIPFNPKNILNVFKSADYRNASFAYFGHIWELFAFWQFLPLLIAYYNTQNGTSLAIPLVCYFIIAAGFVGCIVGGYITVPKGSRYVAMYNIIASGVLCLLSPLVIQFGTPFFIAYLILWGFMVLGDSPQFSTLVSNSLSPQLIGTGITLMTCIGYTVSIFSIQLLGKLSTTIPVEYIFLPLVIGPLVGALCLKKVKT